MDVCITNQHNVIHVIAINYVYDIYKKKKYYWQYIFQINFLMWICVFLIFLFEKVMAVSTSFLSFKQNVISNFKNIFHISLLF